MKIEAVEIWLSVNGTQDDGTEFARSVARVTEIFEPDKVESVASWMAERLPQLPDIGQEGFVRVYGQTTFRLQITKKLDMVLLSVEPKR